MKNKVLLTVTVMVLSGVFLSSTAMANKPDFQNPDGQEVEMKGDMSPEDMPPFMTALDLTQKQLQLLKENKRKKHRKMIKLRAAQEEVRMDLAEALEADTPDRKQVEKIAEKMAELNKEKTLEHADSIIYLKSILTAEQKKKLETIMLMRGGPEGDWQGDFNMGRGKKGQRGQGRMKK